MARLKNLKYTPELGKQITDDIRVYGFARRIAAAKHGVHRETLINWEKRYPEFATLMEQAQAEAAQRWLTLVQLAAREPRNWTAAAWLLERTFPDIYGQRQRIEHTGSDDGAPIKTETTTTVNVVEQVDFDWDAIDAYSRRITGVAGELPPGDGTP